MSSERRRARRALLKVRGRFLLPDGGEHPCETVDASVTGLALRSPMVPQQGERVVAYLDSLGRLEGVVVGRRDGVFMLELNAPSARVEKLARRLTAISGQTDLSYAVATSDRRRQAILRVEFGQPFEVQVGEEKESSARIFAHFRLLPGVKVFLDERPAVVNYETQDGFLIAFGA